MKTRIWGAPKMIRVDGAYLYGVAEKFSAIRSLEEKDTERMTLFMLIFQARQEIEGFIFNSVFTSGFKAANISGRELLTEIDSFFSTDEDLNWNEEIPAYSITQLKSKFHNFETVLRAELQSSALYHVSPKGGFDTYNLSDNGAIIFPPDLEAKVPAAIPDVKAACRCIAFELPTAAAFHLHRANESVLRIYWDSVTSGKAHPEQRNMGVYLNELNKLDCGKKEVREHLKSIKDLHRNPLMHPEQSIDSIDQALDLMAAIRCSIGYMLREII